MHPDDGHNSVYDSFAMQSALRLYMPHRAGPEEQDDPEDGEEAPGGEALPPETLRLLLEVCCGHHQAQPKQHRHRRDKGKKT